MLWNSQKKKEREKRRLKDFLYYACLFACWNFFRCMLITNLNLSSNLDLSYVACWFCLNALAWVILDSRACWQTNLRRNLHQHARTPSMQLKPLPLHHPRHTTLSPTDLNLRQLPPSLSPSPNRPRLIRTFGITSSLCLSVSFLS